MQRHSASLWPELVLFIQCCIAGVLNSERITFGCYQGFIFRGMFAVMEFTSDNTVPVVHHSCIDWDNKCRWMKTTSSKLIEEVKEGYRLTSDWPTSDVRLRKRVDGLLLNKDVFQKTTTVHTIVDSWHSNLLKFDQRILHGILKGLERE